MLELSLEPPFKADTRGNQNGVVPVLPPAIVPRAKNLYENKSEPRAQASGQMPWKTDPVLGLLPNGRGSEGLPG